MHYRIISIIISIIEDALKLIKRKGFLTLRNKLFLACTIKKEDGAHRACMDLASVQ